MEPQDVGGNIAENAIEENAKKAAVDEAVQSMTPQIGNEQIATEQGAASPESLTESLLTEMRDLSRKRLFFQKIATGCMAGMLLVVLLTCVIIVPKAIVTLSRINSVSVKAESSLDEIDLMAKGVKSATDSLNELVSGNSGSLTQAVTSLSQIDIEGLNRAITDLQDAAGPMASLMKGFR